MTSERDVQLVEELRDLGDTWKAVPHQEVCNSDADLVIEAADTIERQRAVIESCAWPMTADRVRVTPGMKLWYGSKDMDPDIEAATIVNWIGMDARGVNSLPCVYADLDGESDELNMDAWYSTKEAALAARREGE